MHEYDVCIFNEKKKNTTKPNISKFGNREEKTSFCVAKNEIIIIKNIVNVRDIIKTDA
jgi:hypothetical protein